MTSKWCVYVIFLCASVCFADDSVYKILSRRYGNLIKSASENTVFRGPNGIMRYYDGMLQLTCFRTSIDGVFSPLNNTERMPIDFLSVEGCDLLPTPLTEELKKLNINTDALETLQLSSISREPLTKGNYTTGLNIKHLLIEVPTYKDYLSENPDFFVPLVNLKTLHVHGIRVPPLPPNLILEEASFNNAELLTWENCKHLKVLRMEHYAVDRPKIVPKVWPAECKQLKTLEMFDVPNPFAEVVIASGIGNGSLEKLYIEGCHLTKLPIEILDSVRDTLKHLYLPYNKFTDTSLESYISMNKVTDVDLSFNQLGGSGFYNFAKKLGGVKNLTMDGNIFFNSFCYYITVNKNDLSVYLSSLEWLSLNQMPEVNVDCFKEVHFAKLKYLGLASASNIKKFQLQKITKTNATNLEVNLKGRKIFEVVFEKEEYEALRDKNLTAFWGTNDDFGRTNLTLLSAELECDCQNYWFARALNESLAFPFNLSVSNFKCKSRGDFIKEPLLTMDCIKLVYDYCVVRITGTWGSERRKQSSLDVECHDVKGDFEYPILEDRYKMLSLNVSQNQLATLRDVQIPNTVQWIDLRDNAISRFDDADTAKLFGRSNLSMWLNGNLFICDCENKLLLDTLHEHRDQVMDFEEIICLDSGKPLSTIKSYEACQIELKVALTIIGAFVILFFIASLVFWRFRFQIRIYLYSRGWCLSCLREEDLDSDRPFDAFLSYAHGDEVFVVEKLLNKLEGDPDKYHICIHFRDWVVGDWIPAQIMRSIQLSKRTIIVLSKNFVGSMWGSLEFRYAVASAAQEGRKRLLVLILDDVLSQELDAELKSYIEFNTYLLCDDPWFWEKLRYAMPHKKNSPEILQEANNEPQNGRGGQEAHIQVETRSREEHVAMDTLHW